MINNEAEQRMQDKIDSNDFLLPQCSGRCLANIPHTVLDILGCATDRPVLDELQ